MTGWQCWPFISLPCGSARRTSCCWPAISPGRRPGATAGTSPSSSAGRPGAACRNNPGPEMCGNSKTWSPGRCCSVAAASSGKKIWPLPRIQPCRRSQAGHGGGDAGVPAVGGAAEGTPGLRGGERLRPVAPPPGLQQDHLPLAEDLSHRPDGYPGGRARLRIIEKRLFYTSYTLSW